MTLQERQNKEIEALKIYAVTGTFHGSIVYAKSEGEARRLFHKRYNGESILSVNKANTYFKNIDEEE